MIDLQDFLEFLAIPSISSESAYDKETEKCAHWVQNRLDKLGFKTELWKTEKHPIIFAEKIVDKNKPTLLIYNHYDVQPVDPLELWDSPPFEPKLIEGKVFARGAQDNKGQCFYVLEALRHLTERGKPLPINIKLCIEGEEECGSESLHKIIASKEQALQADYVAIVDLGIPGPDTPAVTLGTRGLITLDLEVRGAKSDLHSGSHGGLAYNPIFALAKILAEAKDESGKITIPGFYDDVEPFSDEDRKKISFDFKESEYKNNFGILPTGGETDLSPLERNWLRPTFEVNGISGGYTGDGFKTVIPAKAFAKISCRLVPGQSPAKIGELVKDYFEKKAPPGTQVAVHFHGEGGEAARSNPSSKGVAAFAHAYSEVFGTPCKYILEGASIPITPKLAKYSGGEPILVGLGLATDNIHAPNEHFSIDRLEKGAQMIIKAIERLGDLG
jgi:acetylornithine deacetylase/succinyl-diaminopimelate desuccinylase-like protein